MVTVSMKKKNSWIKTELPSMFLLFLGIFAVRSSLADHYYVPSGSMEYALMGGDRVLVSKAAYGLRIPFTRIEVVGGRSVSRGDVVIFDSPRDGTRLIKRIVGIGGDTISLKNGHIVLDGQSLAADFEAVELFDNHVAPLNLEDGGGPDIESLSIPAGMLLAIGDHRGSSLDGRYFGLVRESDIYGKALGVYKRRDEGFVWRSL